MYIEAENLSDALVKCAKKICSCGKDVIRRGFECREFPGAVLIKISNPTDRYVRVPERKWNKTLGWVESLWIARGDNSLDMPASYVKNLLNFSDDGGYMRAGYGPRIRRFGNNNHTMMTLSGNALLKQYKSGKSVKEGVDLKKIIPSISAIDQLKFIVDKFKQDIDTREAVVTIHDPIADNFNLDMSLLGTKDTPCTRSIHFMIVDGRMNCYVDMRSNDLIWGFSAVNVFNFTLMQEYVAGMVGVPVGEYYHKVDNLHVYKDFIPMVEEIAKHQENSYPSGLRFEYEKTFTNLEDFDNLISELSRFEENCRNSDYSNIGLALLEHDLEKFTDDMFKDWAKVIFRYWAKKPVEFKNPFLNELFNV